MSPCFVGFLRSIADPCKWSLGISDPVACQRCVCIGRMAQFSPRRTRAPVQTASAKSAHLEVYPVSQYDFKGQVFERGYMFVFMSTKMLITRKGVDQDQTLRFLSGLCANDASKHPSWEATMNEALPTQTQIAYMPPSDKFNASVWLDEDEKCPGAWVVQGAAPDMQKLLGMLNAVFQHALLGDAWVPLVSNKMLQKNVVFQGRTWTEQLKVVLAPRGSFAAEDAIQLATLTVSHPWLQVDGSLGHVEGEYSNTSLVFEQESVEAADAALAKRDKAVVHENDPNFVASTATSQAAPSATVAALPAPSPAPLALTMPAPAVPTLLTLASTAAQTVLIPVQTPDASKVAVAEVTPLQEAAPTITPGVLPSTTAAVLAQAVLMKNVDDLSGKRLSSAVLDSDPPKNVSSKRLCQKTPSQSTLPPPAAAPVVDAAVSAPAAADGADTVAVQAMTAVLALQLSPTMSSNAANALHQALERCQEALYADVIENRDVHIAGFRESRDREGLRQFIENEKVVRSIQLPTVDLFHGLLLDSKNWICLAKILHSCFQHLLAGEPIRVVYGFASALNLTSCFSYAFPECKVPDILPREWQESLDGMVAALTIETSPKGIESAVVQLVDGFIQPHIANFDTAIEGLWAAEPLDMKAIDDATDQWACLKKNTKDSISAELAQMPDMKTKANKLIAIVNDIRSEVPALSSAFGLVLDDLKSLAHAA